MRTPCIGVPELWRNTSVGTTIAHNLEAMLEALDRNLPIRTEMLLGAIHADGVKWADSDFGSPSYIAAAEGGAQLAALLPIREMRALSAEAQRARILAACALLDMTVHL